MNKFYQLLPLALMANLYLLRAQPCPPPGFPNSGNTCTQAPILCENLDGYCNTINNNNQTQSFPGCPGNVLNNDEWFGFYAGTTSITIVVTPSNCSQSGNMGLQAGIYSACTSGAMDLQCPCSTAPFTLTSNNFVVGQIYYMVLDGCSGNVCDYSIDVVSGSTVGAPPANPGPITGNTPVCVGTTQPYTLAPVPAATMYTWTVTPALGTTSSTTNTANIAWGNTPGTAEVCVTAKNACYSNPTPSCFTVEVLPRPTATLSGTGVICQGQPASVNLTVTFTGNGPWTFVPTLNGAPQAPITTSSNPYTFTVTQAGTWGLQSVSQPPGTTCTGTVSGTSSITTVNVTANAVPTATNCGLSTGSINLTVGGGASPYSFAWSGGQTTEDVSDLPGGTYTVTVTDNNGCTRTATATVNDNPINFTVTPTITANTTCNGGNGSISLSISPNGSYTYNWGIGGTTNSVTGLAPGTYDVTISAGGNCTQTPSFTINNTPNEPNVTGTSVASTCDLPNGAVNISVSGGVSPYTFAWDNGSNAQNLTGLMAGPYTVTVTGANGCTRVFSINVSNNNPPINLTGTANANTTCNGGNGSITVSANPPGAYTYAWDNGATTPSLTGLAPGTYVVTVSGGGSCTNSASFTINDNPNNPNAIATTISSTCDLANGSINVSVTGGVPPYTYLWGGGQNTPNLTMMLAGFYQLTVTGANGCTDAVDVTLNNNNPPINLLPNIVQNTTCNGGNGSISLSVTPAGAYTFSWSTGATTNSITGLTPGVYDVTVSGGGTCSQTGSFTVNDNPNEPNINANPIVSTCDLSNGSIGISVSGGVLPYTYAWSTGATTPNLTNVPAGTYTLLVTAANGCTDEQSITVDNDNPPFDVNPNVQANTSCNANGTGSISLVVTPPGSYTVSWSTGQSSLSIGNLGTGSYTVTVSAGGTCVQILSVDVPSEPNEPQTSYSVTDANCGLSNGSINLNVSASTVPYTYIWSSGQTTQDLNNMAPGVYFVTVTGANGCTTVDAAEIPDTPIPIGIFETITNNTSCFFQGNGAISISTNPVNTSVVWSNGSMTKSLTNLNPGDYTVTVTVGLSCSEVATFTVFDDSEIPVLTADITAATCGLSNGAIDLDVAGGVAPFSYKWTYPNGTMKTTQDISNLPAGEYEVKVTSSTGCSATIIANVPDNPIAIDLLGYIQNNESCVAPNGSIQVDVVPDTYTYTYKWSNNAMTPTISNLQAGTYTLTVTTGNCSESASFEVQNDAVAPNLSVSASAATCGLTNGSVTAAPTGGVTPYKYKWSNSATTQSINNAAPGVYTVTVTGANGCSTTGSATIGNNNIALTLNANVQANNSCIAGNGSIDLSVNPAGTFSYSWSGSQATEDISNLNGGTYTVTVTAGPTCSQTASYTVQNSTIDPELSPLVTAAICGLSNGAIDLSVSTAPLPYTYLWSNSSTTEDLSDIPAGNYSVTVNAGNGCTASTTLNVANNSSDFSLSGVALPLTKCNNANGAINLTIVPAGTYTISWSNGITTEDLNSLDAGTYTVVVTKTGTCSASASYIVEDLRQYPTLNNSITPEVCGLNNGAVQVNTSGGTAPYAYLWSNSSTTEDLQNQSAGAYSLTISDAIGCTATTSATIVSNTIDFAISGSTTTNTSCGTNNGAVNLTVTPSGSYSFNWSNASLSEDLNAIPGGNYAVTVSAGGTCTSVATFNVDDNTLSPLLSTNLSPSVCGANTGTIDLNVNGSVPPFAFNWSTGSTNQNLNNLLAGDYAVTVTGANGCVSVDVFTILENNFSPSVSGVAAPNTACLGGTGAVTLTISPSGTYTYNWAGGQTTQNLANLVAGTYAVTVSAGGSCTSIGEYVVGEQFDGPNISEVLVPSICGQPNGAINVSVSGGQEPYTYKWSNNASSEDLNNILSGNYALTVTASNGCTSTQAFIVPNNSNTFTVSPSITANSACVNPNGGINLSLFPLSNSYTFTWSNGKTTQSISNLPAGAYTVTVNDGSNCTASSTYVITDNISPLDLTGTTSDILCYGQNTGSIFITVNGGVSPYTPTWSPLIPNNPVDIPAGVYKLTLTDAVGCTTTATFTLTQPNSPLQLACAQSKTISQPGAVDGAGTVTISGGTAPYQVVWSPGGSQSNLNAGPFVINNLAEGSYQVTVTDANACTAICGFNIGLVNCVTAIGQMSPNTISVCGQQCIKATYNPAGQFLEPEDAIQYILHSGSGNSISGELARNNQPEFCFIDGTTNYNTTYYISAVAGNTVNGNVNLNDYCTVVAFGTPVIWREQPESGIEPPVVLSCAVKEVVLQGSSTVNGVVYQWSSANGQFVGVQNQAQATAIKAGDYRLIVSINGCADSSWVSVEDVSNTPVASVSANPDDILDCKIEEIILVGAVSGSENANTVWYYNGVAISTENPFPIDAPGLYTFILVDTLSFCADTASIEIDENLAYPPLSINNHDILTCSKPALQLSGGSSFPNIQFRWATIAGTDTTFLSNGNTVTVSAPGTYYLIGRDPVNNCRNAVSTVVTQDKVEPVADAGDPFTMDCFGEIAQLDGSASSGAPVLSFQWISIGGNIVSGDNTPTPTINKPGTYRLTVVNPVNGCSDSEDVVISPEAPIANLVVTQAPCVGTKGRILVESVSGGAPPIRYSLNGAPLTTQNLFNNLEPNTYTLLVQDAAGCSTTQTVTLVPPTPFDVTVTPEVTIKLGDTYTLEASINVPLSTLASAIWKPSTGLSCDTCLITEARPFESIFYNIYVSNENGCKDEAEVRIFVDRRANIYVPNIFSPDGDGANDVFMIFADPRMVNKINNLQVFDRWGNMLFVQKDFQPNDPKFGWDGAFRGSLLNPAVFVWYAEIELVDGRIELLKGDVTLKR